MIKLSSQEVITNSKDNSNRSWLSGPEGSSARERLLKTDSFLSLRIRPKFKIPKTWPVFTIGSCFAREIENVLLQKGLPLTTRDCGLPPQAYETWSEEKQTGGGVTVGKLSRGALNKYNVHSMTHDIKRTISAKPFPNNGLIELAKDKWFDPHASGLKLTTFEKALEHRKTLEAAINKLHDAKVVIMTLGLTETWMDTETGLAMNAHPGAAWLARMPNRWSFVDYDFTQIKDELTDMIQFIRSEVNPDMHFIFTVSPVPLGATAKNVDIIVANSGSKSKLRTVAEEICGALDYCDYFPSYEMALYSPRAMAWQDDQLHVQSSMVQWITEHFLESYIV